MSRGEDVPNEAGEEETLITRHHARIFRLWTLALFLVAILGNVLLPRLVDSFARYTQASTRRATALFGLNWIEVHGSFLMGGVLAQLAGLAIWMAIGKGFLAPRYLVGVMSAFICAVMLLIGTQLDQYGFVPLMGYVVTGVGSVAVTIFVSLFLRLFLRRYRVVHWDDPEVFSTSREVTHQYSMRFLLASMFAVALLCILVRFTLPQNDNEWLDPEDYPSLAVWFFWLSLGISIVAWLQVHCCLGPLSIRAWIAMVFLALLGSLLFQGVASQLIFNADWGADEFSFSIFDESLAIAYLLELGLLVFLGFSLMATRWFGYRLVES